MNFNKIGQKKFFDRANRELTLVIGKAKKVFFRNFSPKKNFTPNFISKWPSVALDTYVVWFWAKSDKNKVCFEQVLWWTNFGDRSGFFAIFPPKKIAASFLFQKSILRLKTHMWCEFYPNRIKIKCVLNRFCRKLILVTTTVCIKLKKISFQGKNFRFRLDSLFLRNFSFQIVWALLIFWSFLN